MIIYVQLDAGEGNRWEPSAPFDACGRFVDVTLAGKPILGKVTGGGLPRSGRDRIMELAIRLIPEAN